MAPCPHLCKHTLESSSSPVGTHCCSWHGRPSLLLPYTGKHGPKRDACFPYWPHAPTWLGEPLMARGHHLSARWSSLPHRVWDPYVYEEARVRGYMVSPLLLLDSTYWAGVCCPEIWGTESRRRAHWQKGKYPSFRTYSVGFGIDVWLGGPEAQEDGEEYLREILAPHRAEPLQIPLLWPALRSFYGGRIDSYISCALNSSLELYVIFPARKFQHFLGLWKSWILKFPRRYLQLTRMRWLWFKTFKITRHS